MKKIFDSNQLSMYYHGDETSLLRYLKAHIGMEVSLFLTDNSISMLSSKMKKGILHVRLHRMFINAGEPVLAEIVFFLKYKRGTMSCFWDFVRENKAHLCKKPPKKISVKEIGRYHNLRELFDEINLEYFGGQIDSLITWSARNSSFTVRRRTLGSYSQRSNTISINPVLDKKSVPRYCLAFVVYHEMLHKIIGISRHGHRRCIHSQEFKKRERLFKDYDKALAWERRFSA
ncbi:MAG: SprT-like domain-containing protein [Dissulfurispiraceae bacterium]